MSAAFYEETLIAADIGIPADYIAEAMRLAGDNADELYGLLCSYEGPLEP